MADDKIYRDWQCAPAATSESQRLGWINSTTEEGQTWLRSQRGFKDFHRALDILAGQDPAYPNAAEYRSKVSTNRLKRNVREVVGAMSKLRPMWGYHSDNKAYAAQAEMMNKVTRAWYLEQFADRSIKEALQYAAATGRGWVRPVYRREMGGTGRGDIKLFTYGAPCVLPFQLPASGDWQAAYAVTILEEMPVYMAHAMFPAYQHRLNPSTSRYWYANDGVRKASSGNLLQRIFGKTQRGATTEALTDLLVPIRYCYVIDLSINKTGYAIPMGETGASWSYTVPSVGQDIPVGIDPRTNQMSYRKANETDARLYPYRRLLISSDQVITYDGPSFDWHGMVPAVPFTMDEWPWEPLGFPLVHDGYDIQSAINKIARGNMDKIGAQLQPSLQFDNNATTMSEARRFDPYKPNDRIGFDGSAVEGGAFHPVVDAETLKVTPESMAMIQWLEQTLDSQMAISDVMALAKMRAVGSMDELEKIMEANGPIIEDLSRAMEPPMRDLGVMVKYLICQYYTTARVMQWVGADGVAPEVFDYDPASLVPSHLPTEDPQQPSATDRIRRARTFADNLRFFILPNSLHELTQMSMKLMLIQLRKAGIMIDSQTIAEACSVPNFGSIDGNTVMERWQREQEMQLELAARGKALAESLGLAGPAGGGAPPGAPKPNGAAPEGRPPSFSAPPSLKSKDSGTRSTVATSK
jgi:hypothetical protein